MGLHSVPVDAARAMTLASSENGYRHFLLNANRLPRVYQGKCMGSAVCLSRHVFEYNTGRFFNCG